MASAVVIFTDCMNALHTFTKYSTRAISVFGKLSLNKSSEIYNVYAIYILVADSA